MMAFDTNDKNHHREKGKQHKKTLRELWVAWFVSVFPIWKLWLLLHLSTVLCFFFGGGGDGDDGGDLELWGQGGVWLSGKAKPLSYKDNKWAFDVYKSQRSNVGG